MKNLFALPAALVAAPAVRIGAACCAVLLPASWSAAQPAPGPRPNIVFILADDLGWRDVGCYGSTFYETPHIDALARRGLRFTQAYAASPLCSPTRSSILTGLFPARTGITAPECHLPEAVLEKGLQPAAGPGERTRTARSVTRLATNYFTIARALRDAGYATGHFGKWHLGPEPYSALQHGFDADVPHTPAPGPLLNGFFHPFHVWSGQGQPGDHLEDRVAGEAAAFIERNKDRPFFLNYWAFEVHSPWQAKRGQIAKYQAKADPGARQRNPVYAGMVESLDDAVGRIVAALERAGVLDRTAILFTSDNGPFVAAHPPPVMPAAFKDIPVTSVLPLRGGKASVHEGGIRVPLIVVWPGVTTAGTTTDALALSTDFLPTFVDLLGLCAPAGARFDGVSLRPALAGGASARNEIFCHFPHPQDTRPYEQMVGPRPSGPASSLRRGDWKLIRLYADHDDGSDRVELYNLRDDPAETRDLAAAKPELAGELNARIRELLADTQAVIPTRNPAFKAANQPAGKGVAGARGVLERTLGKEAAQSVELELEYGTGDSYRYRAAGGKLTVTATSAAALCRGVYDYLRSNRLGTVGWAGPRLRLPNRWPDAAEKRVPSPFRIRHCYNAVTSGYTTPYWGWERWERELDWLAMHGYNMVMAPVATEAIAVRVWKILGLTDTEIAEFYTGPAHLPWQRMGCIRNVGSGLTDSWHRDQIALQKQLLARMRELGIEPIIQGFAGFVPPGIRRLHPEVMLHETHWNGGFPVSQRPMVMLPDTPLWSTIGQAFITEWKKEFGDARYWLVDSFNELQLPKTQEPPAVMLARYGRATYDTIRAADPDAVWVLQGWMFNYQRTIWNAETVRSLVESVPPNDLLVLDYANDYDANWDDFNAFHDRSWVMGYVPNMGGKTAYTGKMDFYATQTAKTLASPVKGNLVGFTVSGEGLENNEALYELMSDTAWTSEAVNLDTWLPAYAANRYGAADPVLAEAWLALRRSAYGSFTPHPSFGWQQMGLGHGSVYRDRKFVDAVQRFLSKAADHGKQPNYRDDGVEMAALALGLRAEDWLVAAREAHSNGDTASFRKLVDGGLTLLLQADQLLESHSLLRLQAWIDHARGHNGSTAEKDEWERNARQIITTWGPPVNDYSCRVWSGLIRDFYVPRLKAMTEAIAAGKPFDRRTWEDDWVNRLGISPCAPLADPAPQAAAWVKEAYDRGIPDTGQQGPKDR